MEEYVIVNPRIEDIKQKALDDMAYYFNLLSKLYIEQGLWHYGYQKDFVRAVDLYKSLCCLQDILSVQCNGIRG